MLIIINKNVPQPAKDHLTQFGEIIELATTGLLPEYLSGHPDLFLTLAADTIVISPSAPEYLFNAINWTNLEVHIGSQPITGSYPGCAAYNAVITSEALIHKTDLTDATIKNLYHNLKQINVNQGMTRCSLVSLTGNAFITSDSQIHATLSSMGFDSLLVTTDGILLPGMKYGLFGGTCGVHDKKLFILGSLRNYCDGEKVRIFAQQNSTDIIELYDGPLFDSGSIFFIPG